MEEVSLYEMLNDSKEQDDIIEVVLSEEEKQSTPPDESAKNDELVKEEKPILHEEFQETPINDEETYLEDDEEKEEETPAMSSLVAKIVASTGFVPMFNFPILRSSKDDDFDFVLPPPEEEDIPTPPVIPPVPPTPPKPEPPKPEPPPQPEPPPEPVPPKPEPLPPEPEPVPPEQLPPIFTPEKLGPIAAVAAVPASALLVFLAVWLPLRSRMQAYNVAKSIIKPELANKISTNLFDKLGLKSSDATSYSKKQILRSLAEKQAKKELNILDTDKLTTEQKDQFDKLTKKFEKRLNDKSDASLTVNLEKELKNAGIDMKDIVDMDQILKDTIIVENGEYKFLGDFAANPTTETVASTFKNGSNKLAPPIIIPRRYKTEKQKIEYMKKVFNKMVYNFMQKMKMSEIAGDMVKTIRSFDSIISKFVQNSVQGGAGASASGIVNNKQKSQASNQDTDQEQEESSKQDLVQGIVRCSVVYEENSHVAQAQPAQAQPAQQQPAQQPAQSQPAQEQPAKPQPVKSAQKTAKPQPVKPAQKTAQAQPERPQTARPQTDTQFDTQFDTGTNYQTRAVEVQ